MNWLEDICNKIVMKQVAQRSTYGKDQINFLSKVVHDFNESPFRKFMDVAWRYYRNENDINKSVRKVIGRNLDNEATLKETKVLANNKLSHNFMKKLTRQKIGYMLGKPFTICETIKDDSLCQEFIKECKFYLTEEFIKRLKNVARDSIVCGMGWIQVYYNEQGALKFRRCAPEEIIPFWKDSDHTELDAIIRFYTVEKYTAKEKKEIKYLEYYLPEGVYYYVEGQDGDYIRDPERPEKYPHFINKGTEDVGMLWENLPFIPFKYDADEQSLLSRIKSLIDDYDRKTSDIANGIDDFPNSLMVIKNYDGKSKEEFISQLNDYRTVFVQNDGDAKSLQIPIDFEGVDKHLERLRQDIYEFGQGVNTADKDIRDTSGVALRFIYADLDMDCIDWGEEVKWSLKQLLWFVQQDILARTGKDFKNVEYSIVFNTDVIVNETETISNCLNSKGLISEKTIAENHPWTLNADTEVQQIIEAKERDLQMQQKYQIKTTTTNSSTGSTGNNDSENKKSARYNTRAYVR